MNSLDNVGHDVLIYGVLVLMVLQIGVIVMLQLVYSDRHIRRMFLDITTKHVKDLHAALVALDQKLTQLLKDRT